MPNKPDKLAALLRITELCHEIRKHDQNYYVQATPTITDLDYDRKLRELTDLEKIGRAHV